MRLTKSWEAGLYQPRFCIGLDVGQQVDFSALSVVSQHATAGPWDDESETYQPEWQLAVRWLERLPLGSAFASVVRRAVALRNDPSVVIPGDRSLGRHPEFPPIVMDATGVGLPLREMFQQQHGVHPIPVVITGGQTANVGATGYHVPKQDLIGSLSVEFELQRIKIASGLDLSDDLLGELRNFRMETSAATGRSTFSAPEGKHDDLLLSVSLAVWWLSSQRMRQGNTIRVTGV